MIRTTTLAVVALLGAGLLTPTAASAAGETCHGQAATLVGSDRTPRLVGTEGPDVVVTNGSQQVDTLGGDDVICVTGFGAQVSSGDGDDLVDGSSLTRRGATARLGAGSDRFIGGPGSDAVHAGSPVDLDQVDTEPDVIETGTGSRAFGPDAVFSGQAGTVNDDVVRMVRGTLQWKGDPGPGAVLDGGSDSSIGIQVTSADDVAIDTGAQTIALGGRPTLTMKGFTGFRVVAQDGPASFSFAGSDRDEQLLMEFWEATPHTVDMGAGDDAVHYYSYGRRAAAGSTYTGGPGRDELELTLPDEVDLDLDLQRGRLALGPRRNEVTIPAEGFEDATLMAEDVEVVGTGRPNLVYVLACRSRVEGRGGDDRLVAFDVVIDERLACKGSRNTFLGGRGDDVLEGTFRRDRLIGGPGRDRADGQKGRDTCQAERTRSCERRA